MLNSYYKKLNRIAAQHISIIVVILLSFCSVQAYAQFEVPEFEKIGDEKIVWFSQNFAGIEWTGQGLYNKTSIDDIQTNKLRSRLQAAFGSPTKNIEDLIDEPDFRPGKAIQFEYWFVVNDSIPLMLLDIDGPFGRGLVYVGASRYIDLMPQIKRTLSRKLMNVDSLAYYQDYFYSPEREQWFNVRYENDSFSTERIISPPNMTYDY